MAEVSNRPNHNPLRIQPLYLSTYSVHNNKPPVHEKHGVNRQSYTELVLGNCLNCTTKEGGAHPYTIN